MFKKRKNRFVVTFQEGNIVPFTKIITDQKTGVQYLVHCPLAGAAAMEVLIDENGKPLIENTDQ